MATHSNVLAWRIPGMGEPGGLPSMGLQELDTTEATQQQHEANKQKHLMRYSSPLIINTENEITTYVLNYTQCHIVYSLSLTLDYLENKIV